MGKELGLNDELTEADTRGPNITLTVCGEEDCPLTDRIVESGRDGAGLFLISCLRHLERRFWNQT